MNPYDDAWPGVFELPREAWPTPSFVAEVINRPALDPMRFVMAQGATRVQFAAGADLEPGDLVSVGPDGRARRASGAPRAIVGIVQSVERDPADASRDRAVVYMNPPYAQVRQTNVGPAVVAGRRFDRMIVDDPWNATELPTPERRTTKWRRIAVAEGLDELVRDLGGLRVISGVRDVKSNRDDFAPDGCSPHGALLVKIDDHVYSFSLGWNDPDHAAKEKVKYLERQTGRRLNFDAESKRLSSEIRDALADVDMSWDMVPHDTEVPPYLVVDVAEGDDAELIDSLSEVFPAIVVEVRGRCTCHPRSDGCVDIMYATDESKPAASVIFEVGVGDRPLVESVVENKTGYWSVSTDAQHDVAKRFVKKWTPEGSPMFTPPELEEQPVTCVDRWRMFCLGWKGIADSHASGGPFDSLATPYTPCTFSGYARRNWTCPKCGSRHKLAKVERE